MKNIKEYSLYAITPKDYKDFYLNYQKRKKSYLLLKEFPKISNYSKSLKNENLKEMTKNLINTNPQISPIKLKDASTDNFNSKTYHYSINSPYAKTEKNLFPKMSPILTQPKNYKLFRTKIPKKDGLLSIKYLDIIKTNPENKMLIYDLMNKNEKIFEEEVNDNILDNSMKEKILKELKKIDKNTDKQIQNIIVNTTSQEKEDSIKYLQTQPKMIYIGAKEILDEIANREPTSDISNEKVKQSTKKIKNNKMNTLNDIFFDYAKNNIKRKIELRNQFNQEISLKYIENLLKNEIRKIVILLSLFDIDIKSENNSYFPKGINTSSSFLIKDLKNKFGINILSKSFKNNLKFYNCHKSLMYNIKKSRNLQSYGSQTQSKYNINIIDKSKFNNIRYNTESEYRKLLIDQLSNNDDNDNKNINDNILNNKINNYNEKKNLIKSPKDKGIFYFYNKNVISPKEKLIKYEGLRKKNNLIPLKIKEKNDDNNNNNIDSINTNIKSYNFKDFNINKNVKEEDKNKLLEDEIENNKIDSVINKGISELSSNINRSTLNKNNDILNLKGISFNKKVDTNEIKEKNDKKVMNNTNQKNQSKIDKNEDEKTELINIVKNEEKNESEIIINNYENKENGNEENEESESSEDSEESEESKGNEEIQNKNDYMFKNESSDNKNVTKSIIENENLNKINSTNDKNKISNINIINKNIKNKNINKYNNYKHINEIEEIDSCENSSSIYSIASKSKKNSVKKINKKISVEIQNEKSKSSKRKKKKKKGKKKSSKKSSPNKKSNKDINSEIKNKINAISSSFKILNPIKRRNSVIFSIKTPIVFNPKFNKIEKTLKRSFSEGDITTERNDPDQVNIIKLHDDDIEKIVDFVNKEEKRRMETEGNSERKEKEKISKIPNDNLNSLSKESNEESNRNKGGLTKDDLIAKLKRDDFKIRQYIEGIIRAGLIKRDKQLNRQMKNNSILVYKNFNLGLFRFNKNFGPKDEIEIEVIFHRPLSHRKENINQDNTNKNVTTKTRTRTKIGAFENPKKELIYDNTYLFSKKKNVNFILRKEVEEILNGGILSQLSQKKEEKEVIINKKKKKIQYSKKDFIKKKVKHNLFNKSIFLQDLIELGEIKRKKEEDAKLKELKKQEELREQNLDKKLKIFIDKINRLKSQDVTTGVGKEEIDEYINQIMKDNMEKNKENRLKQFVISLNDYILAKEKHREFIDTYIYKKPNLIRNLMIENYEDFINGYNSSNDIGIKKDKSLKSFDMKYKFNLDDKNINDKNNINEYHKKDKSYITEINI